MYPKWKDSKSYKAIKKIAKYDKAEVDRIVKAAAAYLTLDGKPFEFLDYQLEEIIKPMFGLRDKKTGERVIRYCHLWLPKGNGKSTMLAALLSLLPFAEKMPQTSQIICCSYTKDQSGIIFKLAKDMLEENGTLINKGRIEIKDYAKTIIYTKEKVQLKLIAAEDTKSSRIQGWTSYSIAEEAHSLSGKTIEALRLSANKMPNPLLFSISTAGERRGSAAFDMFSDDLKLLNDKEVDPHTLPIIYGVPDDEDWEDFSNVVAANPAVGQTIREDVLLADHKRAIKKPSVRNEFLQLRCTRWSSYAAAWLDVLKWDNLAMSSKEFDRAIKGLPCYLGLDLSSKLDLTAMVQLFVDESEGEYGRFYCRSHFWLPKVGIEEKSERDDASYLQWAEDGHMTLLDSDTISVLQIIEEIKTICDTENVVKIGYDAAMAGLLEEMLDSYPLFSVYQGKALGSTCTELEDRIEAGLIQHDGNQVMDYCISNVTLKKTVGGAHPAKISPSLRIDGIIALICAIRAWQYRDIDTGKKRKGPSKKLRAAIASFEDEWFS